MSDTDTVTANAPSPDPAPAPNPAPQAAATADSWVHDTFGVNPATYQPAAKAPGAPTGATASAPGGFFSSIGSALSDAAGSVADVATGVASTVADVATSVAGTVADSATSVASTVADVAGDVATTVGNAAVAVGEAAAGVAETVAEAATGAAETIVDGVTGFVESVEQTLGRAVQGIEDLVSPPHVIGPAQQERADAIKAKLSTDDQTKYKAMQDAAGSAKERQYLEKGLAAGHTLAELEAFQKKIARKDDKWLQDNLALTGDSQGKGVKQQWEMSCNATAVQAVRGEMDPLYALKMHEENPHLTEAKDDGVDAGKLNPTLAADQKKMLETDDGTGYKGVALPRNFDNQHQGRWNTDLLNSSADQTGMTFTNKKVGVDTTEDEGIKSIDDSVARGMPVPIVIGNSSTAYTHYVVVTGADPGPPRTYTIHDPWEGVTYKRTDEQLRTHKLDIANSNQLSAVEVPAQAPVKP